MNKSTKYILFFLSSILFVYAFIKACLLSITWDEAYSYMEYVRKGIFIQDQFDMMSANNHLLNTWLGIFLVKCFGAHEWVLRIPSLIAHLLFLVFSAKLIQQFRTPGLVLASFLILNLHPYLIDFFSLARGYGLSMGLMMTSIYYLYAFHREFRNTFAVLSVFTGALSVLANYVLLNYVMSLFVVIVMLYSYQAIQQPSQKKIVLKNILPVAFVFFLLLVVVVPIAFKLREAGALFFGGEGGFWKDTIHSIVDRSFYELGYNYWFQRMAKAFIFLVVSGACVFAFIKIRKKQFSQNKLFLISMLLILLMCSASVILQHVLLNTLYLVDRTALFFVTLFSVILVFFIHELSEEKPRTVYIIYFTATLLSIHMLLSLNLNYVLEWKLNADTKEMLQDLEKLKTITPEKNNVSINIPLPFETDINFYRDVNELGWLNPVQRSRERNKLDDYYYLTQKELAELVPDEIEILKSYPVTKNVLARAKHRFTQVKTAISQEMDFEKEAQQQYAMDKDTEFSKSFTYVLNDSITPHQHAVIVFEIEAKPLSPSTCDLGMVITLENTQGPYVWTRVSTMDYMKHTDTWTTATFTCIVPEQAKAGDKLSIYLWNPRKQELLIKKMRFKWLEYQ